MTLVPDEVVLAPLVVAEHAPPIMRQLPDAEVSSDGFDLFVTTGRIIAADTAYAIARDMRGGRDFDPADPSDWHVRSLQPTDDRPVLPHLAPGHMTRRTGTRIWLSRSYAAPAGYDETSGA